MKQIFRPVAVVNYMVFQLAPKGARDAWRSVEEPLV